MAHKFESSVVEIGEKTSRTDYKEPTGVATGKHAHIVVVRADQGNETVQEENGIKRVIRNAGEPAEPALLKTISERKSATPHRI